MPTPSSDTMSHVALVSLPLCACTVGPKPPIWVHRPHQPQLMESSPNTPPEVSSQVPQQTPREPILMLPAALTAYVVLIAVIHLRVLLPVEMEDWTVDVFGFIPKRYD